MKKNLLLLLILVSSGAIAQTKIKDGTVSSPVTPNAAAILELESNNKGLLLTRVELANTTTWGLAGAGVQGMLVYNTLATTTSTDAAYPVLAGGKGVYYWDGTGWVAAKMAAGLEPWNVESTSSSASLNTQNIYQNGNVGIGDFSAANPIAKLDVRGAVRTGGNAFTMSNGYYSYPETPHTGVVGINSVAMGYANEASGTGSFASGWNSIASGDHSTAIGQDNEASGEGAIAMGSLSVASGVGNATAIGHRATASGAFSMSLGYESSASGQFASALGHRAGAVGDAASAFGIEVYASGNSSTAIGAMTKAIGTLSTAMGYRSESIGNYSTAIGSASISNGSSSMAIGSGVRTTGMYSTAMGNATIATSRNETVIGYANAITTGDTNDIVLTDPLFQVGKGFPTGYLSGNFPSNAMTILKNGNTGIAIPGVEDAAKPTSTLQVAGSLSLALRVVSTSTSLTDKDHTIVYTGATSTTISLPDPTTCSGRIYRIVQYIADPQGALDITFDKNIYCYDINTTSIIQTMSLWWAHRQFIAGGDTGMSASVTIQSDGTSWYAVGL